MRVGQRTEGTSQGRDLGCQWHQSLRTDILGLEKCRSLGPGPGAWGWGWQRGAEGRGWGRTADVSHWSLPQNQFFISCSDGRTVLNKVGDEIVDRILKAHK